MADPRPVDISTIRRMPPSDAVHELDVPLGALTRRLRLLGVDAAYDKDADATRFARRSRLWGVAKLWGVARGNLADRAHNESKAAADRATAVAGR